MAEKEFIEREAAYELARTSDYYSDFHKSMADLTSLKELLEDAPAADVVEVRSGSIGKSLISKTGYMCTACHSDIDRDSVFCKYCGAKMDRRSD